ncbi:MAG: hypothetical protein LBS95_00245 [Mycoplasmataceae bacterium]|nr:hypothetical protein [Mycoplasmataceae bacterium]
MTFFKKKKNGENKEKWWKSNDTIEMQSAFGANYKVLSGLLFVFMAGLVLMGIGYYFYCTPNLRDNWQAMMISGGIFSGVSLFCLIINLFLKIRNDRKKLIEDQKKREYDKKMYQVEKQYLDSQKHIYKDNERLEELRQRLEKNKDRGKKFD